MGAHGDTTAAVVDAALRLFALRGFDETSAEEIARAAGMDERSFRLRFSSKDDVLAAVARHVSERILRDLAAAVGDARAPADKLRAFMRTSATALEAVAAEYGFDGGTMMALVPRGMLLWQAHLARARTLVLDVLREGVASGAFAVEYPERLATGIVMCLEGLDAVAARRRPYAALVGLDELASVIVRGLTAGAGLPRADRA